MITSFTLENLTTHEKVTFGMDIDCDYLYPPGGIDWGSVPAEHNTYNYPNQVGVSVFSTKIKERDITVNGHVYYMLSEQERNNINRNEWTEYGYSKIKSKKEKLNGLINPSDYVRISTGGYYIEGKPNSSVKYGIEERENNEYFCNFFISIYCNNPMFKKDTITKTVISGDTSAFHFPLILPSYGIVMGTRIDYLLLAVENEGNVQIGGKIIFTARGEVKNPSIENVNTGEKITIKKTMQSGEIITVNTNEGKDRGIIGYYNGVERSYLQYWSFENKWLKFQKGTTLIGYSTENQSENLLDITIELNPEKFALEEM